MNPKVFVELGGKLAEEAAPGLVSEAKVAVERMLASTGLSGPVEQAVESAGGTKAVVESAERFRITDPDDYVPSYYQPRLSGTSFSAPDFDRLVRTSGDPPLLNEYPSLSYRAARLSEPAGLGTDNLAEWLKSETGLARVSRSMGLNVEGEELERFQKAAALAAKKGIASDGV